MLEEVGAGLDICPKPERPRGCIDDEPRLLFLLACLGLWFSSSFSRRFHLWLPSRLRGSQAECHELSMLSPEWPMMREELDDACDVELPQPCGPRLGVDPSDLGGGRQAHRAARSWLVEADLRAGRLVRLLDGYEPPRAPIRALTPPGRHPGAAGPRPDRPPAGRARVRIGTLAPPLLGAPG